MHDENDTSSGTLAATPEQNQRSAEVSTTSIYIAGRYELQAPLAKGGMGVVSVGWDHVLKRTIAVKQLRGEIATPLDVKRFEHEAYISAQLQHPSIPPVYDKGLHDNRPFLVMKLIKGRTLDDLIKNPAGKLNILGIFESIAQAIGYAHSTAVIHRDLKPQNIMVGAFGEVQVMDWGLAKFRSEAELAVADESSVSSTFYNPRTGDDSKTSAGSILGTPAYMPPEQAIGAIDQVNERSDVFGLGGVLCAMLTAKPVFIGGGAEQTRQLAAQGKVQGAFERLDTSGAEREVIALAKRCLAVDPNDRPANGNEVATIAAKLRGEAEERAKQAEIARAAELVRLEEDKKRQRLRTRLALGIAITFAVGMGVSIWQAVEAQFAKRQVIDQLAQTEAETRRAVAAETMAKAKTQQVQDTLAIVQQRTKLAQDAYGEFVFDIQYLLQHRPDTQELRRALLEKARSGIAKILADARKSGKPDITLVWSHFRMGELEQQLGNTPAAQKEYQTAYELTQQLTKADPSDIWLQRALSVSSNNLGDVALQQGRTAEALAYYQQSLAITTKLAEAEPTSPQAQRDLSISYLKLGDVSRQMNTTRDALAFYQKSEAVLVRLEELDPTNPQAQRDLSVVYGNLGGVSLQLGQAKEALAYYQNSHQLLVRMSNADPTNGLAQHNLSISWLKLGDVSLQVGQRPEALAYYQKSLEIAERWAVADPKNAEAQRDRSVCYNKLGNVSLQLNQPQEALAFFQKGLDIAIRLAEADPTNTLAQSDLSVSCSKLGDVWFQMNKPLKALPFYQKSLEVRTRLAKTDPKNAAAQRSVSVSYDRLGDVSLQAGETQDALTYFQKSLAIREPLARADIRNAQAQRDLLVSYFKLGTVHEQIDEHRTAIEWYEKALAVAANVEKPAFFANEVTQLKRQINACTAKLMSANPRELAPPPRTVK